MLMRWIRARDPITRHRLHKFLREIQDVIGMMQQFVLTKGDLSESLFRNGSEMNGG